MLEERFRALGEMIAEYPDIAESSRFVFVPGPTDPGSANIFPRPPLPDCVVGAEEFRRRVPNASFVSNPCRLQYCSQVSHPISYIQGDTKKPPVDIDLNLAFWCKDLILKRNFQINLNDRFLPT